jgi:branched-subunit amino acid aminotransferase/4-amino-4-deoxychorismate lyase
VEDAIDAGGLPDATVRLLWTAGRRWRPAGGLCSSRRCRPATTSCGSAASVSPSSSGRPALAGAKSTSYAENIAAQNEAAERGADDALLVAPDGIVLEAPTSNVWFREGDRLLTPSLSLPLLAGVTRATVSELAPEAGYTVEEGSFQLERLLRADEVFLTSSVREVMPVTSIDGAEIPRGPAAAALQRALRAAAGYPDG